MNDTSGINLSPWVAPSGLRSLFSARPRALPWAGMVGPVGALKVARQLKISTTAVEKTIKRLKAKGVLKRTGPAKGGHWEILQ